MQVIKLFKMNILLLCLFSLICVKAVPLSTKQDDFKRSMLSALRNALSNDQDNFAEEEGDDDEEDDSNDIDEKTLLALLAKHMDDKTDEADSLETDIKEVDEKHYHDDDDEGDDDATATKLELPEDDATSKDQKPNTAEVETKKDVPEPCGDGNKRACGNSDTKEAKDKKVPEPCGDGNKRACGNSDTKAEENEPKLFEERDVELERKIKEAFGDASDRSLFEDNDAYEQVDKLPQEDPKGHGEQEDEFNFENVEANDDDDDGDEEEEEEKDEDEDEDEEDFDDVKETLLLELLSKHDN